MNCSGSTLANQTYFITETTLLTVNACVVTPSICTSTTEGTFTSIGANIPPLGFAALTKKTDNSFLITIFSDDL